MATVNRIRYSMRMYNNHGKRIEVGFVVPVHVQCSRVHVALCLEPKHAVASDYDVDIVRTNDSSIFDHIQKNPTTIRCGVMKFKYLHQFIHRNYTAVLGRYG